MSPEQAALVRASWAKVAPISERAATIFYQRLFQLYPELRPLFKGELDEQGPKLIRMIDRAVGALDDPAPLDRVIKMMGARHCGYGVEYEDYEKFGQVLLWALEQGLGDGFNGETRAAWVSVYGELADLMREGAAQ